MNFGILDTLIVCAYLIATVAAGLAVRRAVGKVEHFLVAGRQMDLHLGVASLAATEFGVITCMYAAEMGYRFGFAGVVPGILMALSFFVVGRTGFCIEPLRAAGVVTIPELLEKKFGKGIRTASAAVAVIGGLLNMGLFLRMGGEFLVGVGGIRPQYLEITMTVVLLAIAFYTVFGGMLSVLVTDLLQFVVMGLGLLAVTLLILYRVGWDTLVSTVQSNYGAGGFNPFAAETLGGTFVLYNGLLLFAASITWQPAVSRVLAAKDPKVGGRIYSMTSLFFVCRFLFPAIWGIAALAVVGPALLSGESTKAMPQFLAAFVPTGLLGILVASMLAAEMSTDSSYMLTWSSIIYNDLLAPIRRHWSERKGLLVNRLIVAAIGLFLLLWGLWYPLKGPLWNYISITGTIHLSSASVLLIACCYWRKASPLGAALAIVGGAATPLCFLVLQQMAAAEGTEFGIRTEVAGVVAFTLAAAGMLAGSLLRPGVQGGER